MDRNRVLVVGAGPVGMVAATYLAQQGIPVSVFDANPDLPEDLRASTFHPPTLDMLDQLGVADDVVAQGLICPTWQFRDRRAGAIATFDLGLLAGETAHPYRLQCEQWKLTRILRERLHASGLATMDFAARAIEVQQDDDGVSLTIERPDGSQEVTHGRYIIGTDGARSAVRKSLGVGFDGMTIPEIYFTASTTFAFEEAMPDLARIAYVSDPDEWLTLLRTPTLWRVLLPTDPTWTDEQVTNPDTIQARLQAIAPNPAGYEVVHKTAYRVHERVADKYVVGRCFLAGDAAHLNNPLGGMGMNGGIHDAMNLTEKLVQIWNGAPIELMGRYERQRRKVAVETVQTLSLRNRRNLSERDPDARVAQQAELRRTVADPAAHREYVRRSSMLQSLRDLENVA